MAKRQLNVQVDEEVQAMLDAVMSRNRVSKNQLVEDVLRNYLIFWEEAQRAKEREIERQRELLHATESAGEKKPSFHRQPRRRAG